MARMKLPRHSRDERGVSDVLSIAFMFLIVIFAGVLLHSYRFGTIGSASDRQLQLKAEYLYRTLELSEVENYSVSYLGAIAENVIGITPRLIPGDQLRSSVDTALGYLRPPGYGVMIELTRENSSWVQVYPSNAGAPSASAEKFTFSGKVTLILAEGGENRAAQAEATLTMFKVG